MQPEINDATKGLTIQWKGGKSETGVSIGDWFSCLDEASWFPFKANFVSWILTKNNEKFSF